MKVIFWNVVLHYIYLSYRVRFFYFIFVISHCHRIHYFFFFWNTNSLLIIEKIIIVFQHDTLKNEAQHDSAQHLHKIKIEIPTNSFVIVTPDITTFELLCYPLYCIKLISECPLISFKPHIPHKNHGWTEVEHPPPPVDT